MILKSDALGNWPVLVCSLISRRNISPENDGKVGLDLNWGCWWFFSRATWFVGNKGFLEHKV